MKLKYDFASLNAVQQTLSGTGVFNGDEVGRASVTFGTGAAQVIVLARDPGAWANVFTVALVNQSGVNLTLGHNLTGTVLKIYLRRNGAGILSTATEVANYINSNEALSALFAARSGGADVVVAAAATALAGGVDATTDGYTYRLVEATNGHGGLFVFSHDAPIDVVRVSGRFTLGTDLPLKVQLIDVSAAFAPTEAEAFTLYTSTLTTTEPSFCLNGPFTLNPGTALRVTIAAPGAARVTFQRSARPRLV